MQRRVSVWRGKQRDPGGLENSRNFAQRLIIAVQILDDAEAHDGIEGVVRERDVLDVADLKSMGAESRAREMDHRLRDVQTVRVVPSVDQLRRQFA